MTQNEREQLERDNTFYLWLLDYYAKNRDAVKSMTDKEYQSHIDDILDEINLIRKLLENEQDTNYKNSD